MAVEAQFLLPPYAAAEEQMFALIRDYGTLLSAAAAATPGADAGYACGQRLDHCAAQSDLTWCNDAGRAGAGVPSRKRTREDDDDELRHYGDASFLPLPGMRPHSTSSATDAPASTSGRRAEAPAPAAADAVACELWRMHGAEVDALVRAECARLRAGLEAARKRQRNALVRAAVSGLARRAREAEAQLVVARRRAAELEERVRVAASEAQAWCGVARGNEAVAAGLRATLDALLLRSSSAGADEGFGESEPEDAQSCCYEQVALDTDAATGSSPAARWACRACGEGEATVLVLPCRHLCMCKACEPRTDACPVCAGAKNAAIHVAPN